MARYLGFDTSNYKTSVALYDSDSDEYINIGKMLPVEQGKLGLRQSEAVFEHVKQLPELVKRILRGTKIKGVGVSTKPRAAEGSYMPCFRVGECAATCVASALGVPLYSFSHQQGHIAAAVFSSKRSLKDDPFLAWHLSGGTTELLLVEPDSELIFKEKIIGGSTDISAGQLIDRTGIMLGFEFPSGPSLDHMSLKSEGCRGYKVRSVDSRFSLSGMENKVVEMLLDGVSNEDIAYFVVDTVCGAIVTASLQARDVYGDLPLLCSGGVFANTILRKQVFSLDNVFFASTELSGDNALGIAYLCHISEEG